jgi:uncharacterized protein
MLRHLLLLISAVGMTNGNAAVTTHMRSTDRSRSSARISRPYSSICYLSSPRSSPADTVPRPVSYVNDFDSLFTAVQGRFLDSVIARFDRQTTIQIAVVTIDTTMTTKEDFDNYALRILNVWGVGKEQKKNGIVVAISRGYRMIRVQNDYGIKKILSDKETKMIIDTAFIPLFKKGKYFEGTLHGIQTLMGRLSSPPPQSGKSKESAGHQESVSRWKSSNRQGSTAVSQLSALRQQTGLPYTFFSGNSSVNVVPFPTRLSALIFPSCASTIVFT